MNNKKYVTFAAMIVTAMVAMYAMTYLNTYQMSHVHFSETRFYMTLLMGAAMAVIMLLFMWSMYPDIRIKVGILVSSTVLFFGSLWLMRSQVTVEDVSYMRAMIPHHSIAILTSERAQISDPRVRELADGIIAAQRKEIAEMEALITDLESRPANDFPQADVK